MPHIGETAPDFELPNQDGKMTRLSDFRGKKVIMFAYPRRVTGMECLWHEKDVWQRIHGYDSLALGD